MISQVRSLYSYQSTDYLAPADAADLPTLAGALLWHLKVKSHRLLDIPPGTGRPRRSPGPCSCTALTTTLLHGLKNRATARRYCRQPGKVEQWLHLLKNYVQTSEISRSLLLKWQCHQKIWNFFHESRPPKKVCWKFIFVEIQYSRNKRLRAD